MADAHDVAELMDDRAAVARDEHAGLHVAVQRDSDVRARRRDGVLPEASIGLPRLQRIVPGRPPDAVVDYAVRPACVRGARAEKFIIDVAAGIPEGSGGADRALDLRGADLAARVPGVVAEREHRRIGRLPEDLLR